MKKLECECTLYSILLIRRSKKDGCSVSPSFFNLLQFKVQLFPRFVPRPRAITLRSFEKNVECRLYARRSCPPISFNRRFRRTYHVLMQVSISHIHPPPGIQGHYYVNFFRRNNLILKVISVAAVPIYLHSFTLEKIKETLM